MVLAMMENEGSGNTYEETRKQRLLENKKRFEDLGIMKIAKSLTNVTKSEKPQNRQVRQKTTSNYSIEPRRSSRARNQVTTYRDEYDVGDKIPTLRKRSKFNSSWTSYLARPAEEVKVASYEERARAFNSAEKLRSNLETGNPSFVKSMVRSHVYSCFWLGLPGKFCEDHLPKSTADMVLENEEGSEYEAVYISKRTGLSGGWRAFALDHKLDDGDALVFELVDPTRFKIYIVRAFECQDETDGAVTSDAEEKPKKKRKTKDDKRTDSAVTSDAEEKPKKKRKTRDDKRTDSAVTSDAEEKSKKRKTRDDKRTDSAVTSDAEEKPKKKRKAKDDNHTDSVVTSDAEEKQKKKRMKKDENETEKSAEVSGRRSLRNKGK